MDPFEKQQTIEAVKTVVTARWFYASVIFLQGIIIKLFFPSVPLASTPILSLVLLSSFIFNFGYWLYLRRPPEKMSNFGLQIIKALQVVMDQVWISAILYFSGTVGKMVVLLYFVAIMVGASLYKKKGVILSTLLCQFIFTILVVLQYKGLMKSDMPVKEVFSFKFTVGGKEWLTFVLVSFYSYSSSAAIFAGYLANLFRKREKRLTEQKNELTEKTVVLTHQTQELTQAKSLIQDALAKSDKARIDLSKTKEELEKANLELRGKIGELEKFSSVAIGRELKMVELKKEIKNLQETIKKLESQLSKKK